LNSNNYFTRVEYWENGSIKYIDQFNLNNELNGISKYYYNNGNIHFEVFYKSDVRLSVKTYLKSGQLEQYYFSLKSDTIFYCSDSLNGTYIEALVWSGNMIYFYKNGKIKKWDIINKGKE
jgi:antitoxin component YwqK of YwqJK toxin-antitoxin module